MDNKFITVSISEKTESKVDLLQSNANKLFKRLTVDSEVFNCSDFVSELNKYIMVNDRIYYSVFSNIIYNSIDSKVGTIITNLDKLVEFTECDEFRNILKDNADNQKQIEKIILKLWDHSHLAYTQLQDLNKDDFFEKFIPERREIEEEIKEEGKRLNKELISMVGIFTAMAFLVFGGLNSLSDILSSAIQGIPVLNVSIVCLLWGLCTYNLIYLFMYLVGKIIDKSIASRLNGSSFIKRHIVYFIGNSVLLLMLFVVGWLYFIKCDFQGWYGSLCSIFGNFSPFLPVIVIIVAFLIIRAFIWIFKRIRRFTLRKYYERKYAQKVIVTKDAVYDKDWNFLQDR